MKAIKVIAKIGLGVTTALFCLGFGGVQVGKIISMEYPTEMFLMLHNNRHELEVTPKGGLQWIKRKVIDTVLDSAFN